MKKLDIIDNIELPPKHTGRKLTLPFDSLEVGAGFDVPDSGNSRTIRQRAYAYGKRHGKRFTTRDIGGFIRVKRTV